MEGRSLMLEDLGEVAWEDAVDRHSGSSIVDPYPEYAAARRVGPVHLVDVEVLQGMPEFKDNGMDRVLNGRNRVFACYCRDEIVEVFRDRDHFCSEVYNTLYI